MLEQIREEARRAVLELLPQARLQRGDILVVGCSTSEVCLLYTSDAADE